VPGRRVRRGWQEGQLQAPRPQPTLGGVKCPSDPFDARVEIPVAGGVLNVARAGALPWTADAVVVAVHGVTGSHLTWLSVARKLTGRTRACLLAPDLRGRGRSAALPGPYGMATHVADLTAMLDHVGARRAVLVGHSMGAYVVARLAAEHGERAAGVVLLDGGLPLPAAPRGWDEDPEDDDWMVGRMDSRCVSADEYLASWRAHPAFAHAWDDDVEAYARYDMVADGHAVRCVVSEEAVMTDSTELLVDTTTRTAVTRVRTPVRLLRAPRGPLDDEHAIIARGYLDSFAEQHPHLEVEHVPGTNHHTLILGNGPGPSRVAAAIERVMRNAAPARCTASVGQLRPARGTA
jgi:pimeloyl-ACP methyl ester carboxylesterase